jgi:DNA repair protein RecO (recombination protein O)
VAGSRRASQPQATSTRAVVLRARPFGEADRIVTFLGRASGRVSALARGARKSTHRFAGGLGLGTVGEATWRDRAGAELGTLDAFDVIEANVALGEELGRTAHAAYALELVEQLCPPRQAEPAVFDWLVTFLERLARGAARAERLRIFELGLLARLGIGPVVDACAVCGKRDFGEEVARWMPGRGGLVCGACVGRGPGVERGPSAAIFPVVRRALGWIAGADIEEGERVDLPREVNQACRSAIFEVLQGHLRRPLRSLEFLAKL